MFTHNGSIYADAGKVLVSKSKIGYKLPLGTSPVEEKDIDLSSLSIKGRLIVGDVQILNHPTFTFDQWKAHIVKWRYTNDDQIAIMLNKDNGDNEMYNFMQEWRKWFSNIVHNIEKLYNTEKNITF